MINKDSTNLVNASIAGSQKEKSEYEKAIEENLQQIENDNQHEEKYLSSLKDTLIKSK